jgi:site-specific DNA-methyltransferase (adenine-specific)
MTGFIAPNSVVTHEDCMALMARYPDKYFDLAIVDPPYGIGAAKMTLGKGGGNAKSKNYTKKDWDKNAPDNDYFTELFRVSKHQIIWGANHLAPYLPASKGWIVWQKMHVQTDYAPFELAFTSFEKPMMIFYLWAGYWQGDMKNKENRIHPTQKPVALYDWIFKNYAKEGDKILDTHLGSGSSRISAWKAGLDFTACELDADYFAAQEKRFKEFTAQMRLF